MEHVQFLSADTLIRH